MMEQFIKYFGEITPFLLMGLVTALTEVTKKFVEKKWSKPVEGLAALLVCVFWSTVFIYPFIILKANELGDLTPFVWYAAFVYTLLASCVSSGIYSIGKTVFEK